MRNVVTKDQLDRLHYLLSALEKETRLLRAELTDIKRKIREIKDNRDHNEEKGKFIDQDSTILCCILCRTNSNLCMVPHRNKDGIMVGWLFACNHCQPAVADKIIVLLDTPIM